MKRFVELWPWSPETRGLLLAKYITQTGIFSSDFPFTSLVNVIINTSIDVLNPSCVPGTVLNTLPDISSLNPHKDPMRGVRSGYYCFYLQMRKPRLKEVE